MKTYRVYIISSADDPCQLPLGVFDTLRECASFMGISYDYLKACRCGHRGTYATKYFLVEGVVFEDM